MCQVDCSNADGIGEVFSIICDKPDSVTGMWIVEPDLNSDGTWEVSVLYLDSLVALCIFSQCLEMNLYPRTSTFCILLPISVHSM